LQSGLCFQNLMRSGKANNPAANDRYVERHTNPRARETPMAARVTAQ
jgi:hypothetical protein